MVNRRLIQGCILFRPEVVNLLRFLSEYEAIDEALSLRKEKMHLCVYHFRETTDRPPNPKLVPGPPKVRAVLVGPQLPLPSPVSQRQAEIHICSLRLGNSRLLAQEESLEVMWGTILEMEKMRPEVEKLGLDPDLMIPGPGYSLVCIPFVCKGRGSMGNILGSAGVLEIPQVTGEDSFFNQSTAGSKGLP